MKHKFTPIRANKISYLMQCDLMCPLRMTYPISMAGYTTLKQTTSAFITGTPQLTSHLFQVDEHE